MKEYVPLRDVAHLKLKFPTQFEFVNDVMWLPLGRTELHLTAFHFPIALRFDGGRPSLGVILSDDYLARPIVADTGAWLGSYKPIALRCFPLRIAEERSADPLQELEITNRTRFLASQDGIAISEESGGPSSTITKIYHLLRLLRDGQDDFLTALDQLSIAGLVAELKKPEGADTADGEQKFYVVNAARFASLGKRALAAMARQNFLSIDVAVSCIFSQRLLKPERLANSEFNEFPETASLMTDNTHPTAFGLADLKLALDESELFSVHDIADPLLPTEDKAELKEIAAPGASS
jgi:hypothetical protein